MDNWPTRFVVVIAAAILTLMPAKVNILDADSVLARSVRQYEDGGPPTGADLRRRNHVASS